MIEELPLLVDNRWKDMLCVIIPNGAVLAAVNLAPVSHLVTIAAGLVTIGYAAWRWRRDSYVLCQSCLDGRPPHVCPMPPQQRPKWCPKNL